ncbi:MAG TPA: AsmA family protein [Gammaproteobacteria bacterium]|nr:AsmA family protein [Gammaproteobacteria bacterium]
MNKTAKKTLKIAGIFIAALIVLLIAIAVVLPFIIDPNDYRDDIEAAVTDATGRSFEIAGPMELSVFPWLGLEIHDVTLGNAPGFGPKPFAHLAGADIQVKLLPLLSSEVEVGEVVIRGLEVNLARDRQGKTNWDDLMGGDAANQTPETPSADSGPGLASLKIGGVTLEDARITFTDAQASRQYTIAPLNLEMGAFSGGEPFNLEISTDFAMTNPQLNAQLVLDTQVQLDLANKQYTLSDGNLTLSASGSPIPLERADIQLTWEQIRADLQKQTATLADIVLQGHGAKVQLSGTIDSILDAPQGSLTINVPSFTPAPGVMDLVAARLPENASAQKLAPFSFAGDVQFNLAADTASISDAQAQVGPLALAFNTQVSQLTQETPQLEGTLKVAPFSPVQVTTILGVELPKRADSSTLTQASLQAGFAATPNSLTLEPLLITLDDSQLTGSIAVPDIAQQKLRFDLTLDAINLDRYLPPASEKAPEAASAGELDAIELPVEPLRDRNVAGTFKIGQLQVAGLQLNDIVLGVTAKNDALRLHPFTANLYGGSYEGDVTYDVSGPVPTIAAFEELQDVQIGDLLTAMYDLTRFTGTTDLTIDITAQGKTVGDLRRSLDGTAAIALNDGALLGASLWDAITGAYADLQGEEVKGGTDARTPITELGMSLQINNGIAKSDDLKARLPYLAITGNGVINLVENAVDYHLRAKILGTPEVDGLSNIKQLEGLTIPVQVSGSMSGFSVRPDLGAALAEKKAAAIEAAKEEARAEAEQRLEQEKQAAKEAAEEEAEEVLKDTLRGLFD